MSSVADLFEGFASRTIATRGIEIFLRTGGQGPPLLLLHGYPETHVSWHRIAAVLKDHFTLVIPDLRGYGRSSCPPSDDEHRAYSKRTMALDIAAVMSALGHARFRVMGQDRGARVGFRLALDAPDRVSHLVAVGIVPTLDAWRMRESSGPKMLDQWVFLAQPAPLPESLISQDPAHWVKSRFARATRAQTVDAIHPAALADYVAMLSNPDRVHATCEDHRAGARIDVRDDADDAASRRRIACPVLVLWGEDTPLAGAGDLVAAWQGWADRVSGVALPGGHYLVEECPDLVIANTLAFLAAEGSTS